MRTVFLIIIVLLCAIPKNNLSANLPDEIDYVIQCEEQSWANSDLFVEYWNDNKLDSARILLNYWEDQCGYTEPVMRAFLILDLYENNFAWLNYFGGYNLSYYYVKAYKERAQNIKRLRELTEDSPELRDNNLFFDYIPLDRSFDSLTSKIAQELVSQYDSTSTEWLFCKLYSDLDFDIYKHLKDNNNSDLEINRESNYLINQVLAEGEVQTSLITGIWIPTGQLSKLGKHAELGFAIGGQSYEWGLQFTFLLRFAELSNNYLASGPDVRYDISNYVGGYVGLDFARSVIVTKSQGVAIVAGLGYDGFGATVEEEEDVQVTESSFNINFGLRYRFHYDLDSFLGIAFKYNLMSYNLPEYTGIRGNSISIQLEWGGLFNSFKYDVLKTLKY